MPGQKTIILHLFLDTYTKKKKAKSLPARLQVAIDVELRQKTLLQGEVTLALYAKDTGYEAKIDDRSLNQLLKDKYHQQPVVNVNKNNALKPHRGTSTLEIVIPLAGIDSLLEICQRCRPHKLGEIQFASSGLMELD